MDNKLDIKAFLDKDEQKGSMEQKKREGYF